MMATADRASKNSLDTPSIPAPLLVGLPHPSPRPMPRRSPALALSALLLGAAQVPAQEFRLPTPEEYAERALRAEQAPLFAEDGPLTVTLRTDISRIRQTRSVEEELEGTLTYTSSDGTEVTVPVKVRARGNFRRQARNCSFPPLRLNFAGRQARGTLFEDQDKLKLVTPCHDTRDNDQQYVLQEYLAYRTLQLLTPTSYRVRLLRVTYEDPDGGYDTRTVTAFVLEGDEQMARRNRATLGGWEQLHPGLMDPEPAALADLFQFMIGNTDFSTVYFHNATGIRTEAGKHQVVPYDFDWSGVVSARYAVPDGRLPIRSVQERLYRGFCHVVDQAGLIQRFNDAREGIWSLYESMEELAPRERERALRYYKQFYDIINDPRKFRSDVTESCLKIPS